MINKNFVLPSHEIALQETERRLALLPTIMELFGEACSAIMVTGSMATGQNYSIHPESDIDISLMVSRAAIEKMKKYTFISDPHFQHYINGYEKNIAYQFSTEYPINGVKLECHFWDTETYQNAIKNREQSVMRFRSSNTSPSINYGFGFEKQEITTILPTKQVKNWYISPFPIYIRENDSFFPCRGLTNFLAKPIILKGEAIINELTDLAWKWVVEEVKRLPDYNANEAGALVINSIPGNWKFSDETKDFIIETTKNYFPHT